MCFKPAEIIGNKYFYPSFLSNSFKRVATSAAHSNNILVQACVNDLANHTSKKSAIELRLLNGSLQDRIRVREIVGFSICYSLMRETSPDIKAMLMECTSVAYKVIMMHQKNKEVEEGSEFEDKQLNEVIKLRSYAANLLTLHVLELFRSTADTCHKIFAGMAGGYVNSILAEAPNSLIKKLIIFLFVPSLVCPPTKSEEYLQVFEKFIDAAFDSGFSEYFLSNIAFFKQILLGIFQHLRETIFEESILQSRINTIFKFFIKLAGSYPIAVSDIVGPMLMFCDYYFIDMRQGHAIDYWLPVIVEICLDVRKCVADICRRKDQKSIDDMWIVRQNRDQKMRTYEENSEQIIDLPTEYMRIGRVIHRSLYNILEYSIKTELTEKFEVSLVKLFCSINSMSMRCLARELYFQKGVSIEDIFSKLIDLLKYKKPKLDLITYVISNPIIGFVELMHKFWPIHFALFKEKSLAVEIICANYNIIFGLKNFSQLVSENTILAIFHHSVSSMVSKNRKLINNCLKTFGCLLTYYPSPLVAKIFDMELPNVFYDEMSKNKLKINTNDLTPADLCLKSIFIHYLKHKYNRYAMRLTSILHEILQSLHAKPPSVSARISAILAHCLPSMIDRMSIFENYTLSLVTTSFMLDAAISHAMPRSRLDTLADYGIAMMNIDVHADAVSYEESRSCGDLQRMAPWYMKRIYGVVRIMGDSGVAEKMDYWMYQNSRCFFERVVLGCTEPGLQMPIRGGFIGSSSSFVSQVIKDKKEIVDFIVALLKRLPEVQISGTIEVGAESDLRKALEFLQHSDFENKALQVTSKE